MTDVREVWESTRTYRECADWVERMRHADSLLTAFSDERIAAGVDRLRSAPGKLARSELTLLVMTKI